MLSVVNTGEIGPGDFVVLVQGRLLSRYLLGELPTFPHLLPR